MQATVFKLNHLNILFLILCVYAYILLFSLIWILFLKMLIYLFQSPRITPDIRNINWSTTSITERWKVLLLGNNTLQCDNLSPVYCHVYVSLLFILKLKAFLNIARIKWPQQPFRKKNVLFSSPMWSSLHTLLKPKKKGKCMYYSVRR